MTWEPTHEFQIACGVGGAFVDVTDKILIDQGGVVRSWGRQSSFSDFPGGTFAFTLDNRDGPFTPDNTNAGATPISEGMVVTWQTDTRLLSGKIAASGIQFILADTGTAESARLRITVGDQIALGARQSLPASLAAATVMATNPYFYYPLNDPTGAVVALDQSGNHGPSLLPIGDSAGNTFGVDGVPAVGETQLELLNTAFDHGLGAGSGSFGVPLYSPTYAPGSLGFIGCWVTMGGANTFFTYSVVRQSNSGNVQGVFQITAVAGSVGANYAQTPGTISIGATAQVPVGVPVYVAAELTYTLAGGIYTTTVDVYINGSLIGTQSVAQFDAPPVDMYLVQLQTFILNDSVTVSHVSHTATLAREDSAGVTTLPARIEAIAAADPDMVLATLPTDLTTAPVGMVATSSQSVTDALNDAIRTEQGQLFTTTTGSVTAPVQTVGIRARTRPTDVTAVWVAKEDIQSDAVLIRDLSNTVSEVDVSGPAPAVYIDLEMREKVQSANTSFAVIYNNYSDSYVAGSDRLGRAKKSGIDVQSFTVQGMGGTDTDRSADLLALTLGDRHQVAGLPETQLGYETWDGFLSGVDEDWTSTTASFTFWLEPTGPRTAVFNTDRFMAGGVLSLSADITSTATSMSVVSANTLVRMALTAEAPYTIVIDQEHITVTACTGANPQVATITRGVDGTTPAAHTAGALPELAIPALFAY